MKRKLSLIGLLAGFLFLMNCNKDEDPSPQPPSKANIKGSVQLYSEGPDLEDPSGMIISVDGSGENTMTDLDGNFELNSVEFGEQTLIFTKEGYGTFKMIDVEHPGPDNTILTQSPSLCKRSSTEINSLSATINGNAVQFEMDTDPGASSNDPRYLRFFFHDGMDVSASNYTSFSEVLQVNINPAVVTFLDDELEDLGYESGSIVYVKVYGDSYYGNTYVENDVTVFPNVNSTSADAVMVVVP